MAENVTTPTDERNLKFGKLLEVTKNYSHLNFPNGSPGRPYVMIDMVCTIDGKTVSGERNDTAADLGSSVDHALLKQLEGACDSILVGATTVRYTTPAWNPGSKMRVVVSNSGDLPWDAGFFKGNAFVATTIPHLEVAQGVGKVVFDSSGNGMVDLLAKLRAMEVGRLLVQGGSTLNAQLLELDLVDELFLTISPKVKLGEHTPTYAGGQPLSRDDMLRFKLVTHFAVEDEVFLRYRRERS